MFTASKCTQSRFINYFGGPCVEFGRLLYNRLVGKTTIGAAGKEEEESMFVAALTQLRRASSACVVYG